ncbi:MAG: lamin tail domain-containing protein, partial [Porticoccaceae bacterium]
MPSYSRYFLIAIGIFSLNSFAVSSENTSQENQSIDALIVSKILSQQSTTGPSGQIISWDIDKDGDADALTDGLLMLRYTFGLRDAALTENAISTASTLSSSQVSAELEATLPIADIDGDGQIDALTDALILLRYLFGLTGESLTNGAVATGAVRATPAAITQYLMDNMPGANNEIPSTVVINEVASSNSFFDDEDGDSPDWFELFNNGDTAVDLTGWSITDDSLEPTKWVFPETVLAPGAYLRVWASNKDRVTGGTYRTLVNQGDNFRYIIPTSNPSNSWINLGFNDSSWQQGTSGFGYADGDDSTIVPNGTRSVYVRKTFTVNDLEFMDKLWLDIDFD